MLRKFKLLFIILLFSVFIVGCKTSKNSTTTDEIDINEQLITDVLTFLTSEENQGRLTGTQGNENVVEYIKGKYNEFGLKSPSEVEDYEQKYNQRVRVVNKEPKLSLVDENGEIIKEYRYIYDFNVVTSLMDEKIKGEITSPVFQINGYQTFTSNEVKDKFGMITFSDLVGYNYIYGLRNMIDGSYGVIIEYTTNRPIDYIPVAPNVTQNTSVNENGQMTLYVTHDVFEEIKDKTNQGALISVSMDCDIIEVETKNVIGYFPTSDKEHQDEYLILSAHLDHVGSNGGNSYNPGAFDNASGISAILEIARYLSNNKELIKKNIVFIAFNGEEEGLYGSTYYVNNPIFPLKNSQVINLDMVGSKANVPLSIDYCSSSFIFKNKIGNIAKQNGFNVLYDESKNSDHGPFCEAGAEAITLINLDYTGYHSPLDTIDNVDIDKLVSILKVIIEYISQ